MSKGFNTIVLESKGKLVQTVNEITKDVPISVVALMLENVLQEVNSITQQQVKQEKDKYEQEQKENIEQVEYVPEHNAQ